jgi:enoyl-CoA hydratase/carnithine racemase
MNTISMGLQSEAEKIFKERILPNKEVKAVIFISSKPDNFIAGMHIEMFFNKYIHDFVHVCI